MFSLPGDVMLLASGDPASKQAARTREAGGHRPHWLFSHCRDRQPQDAAVRRALAPLAQVADKMGVAIAVVAHLTKDDSTRLINRVSGSGAFVNAARSVLVLARDPDDPDGEQGYQRVLVHVTPPSWGRLASTMQYQVEPARWNWTTAAATKWVTSASWGGQPSPRMTCSVAEKARLLTLRKRSWLHWRKGALPSAEVKLLVAAKLSVSQRTVMRHAMALEGQENDGGHRRLSRAGPPGRWERSSDATPVVPTPSTPFGTTGGTTGQDPAFTEV